MILAGDIGGTHTRLALFEKGKLLVERKFSSRNYPGVDGIVREFLRAQEKPVEKICLGVAGPVREGRCRATNLPWIVDAKVLREATEVGKVFIINDLEANAYGLRVLKKEELFLLQEGVSQAGNQALIAAGTGLGEAGLYWDGKEHCPFACEGGHTDFGPRDEKEAALLQYLSRNFEHVSYERLVSGPGLRAIYQFILDSGRGQPREEIEKEMTERDPAKVITEWGMNDRDPACAATLDWFLSLYGAEAGNLALKLLALGGLFIGGGIAPRVVERMKKSDFVAAFSRKGRFKSLLQSIPIWVILNDNTALLGAAYYAEHKG